MSGYTALPTKSAGDLLTSALWNTYLQGNADSGFMRKVGDGVVSGSSLANIGFASIPAVFAHLMVVVYARSTSATATFDTLTLQVNGDTAANYCSSIGGSIPATSLTCGYVAGGASSASCFMVSRILIPHYTNTAGYKELSAEGGGFYTTTSFANFNGSGSWFSLAAINQIVLRSSSGNLDIGTRMTLYGIPA